MKGVCPHCEKVTDLEKIKSDEVIVVRREEITVSVELYRCSECREEFEDPSIEVGPVELAYQEYRRRKDLLRPEEIRDFRNRFGLSQSEFSKLLGFGGASISRYENGALQDEAHDKLLRFAMEPHNLLQLIEKTPDAIPKTRRMELVTRLKENYWSGVHAALWERLTSYGANHQSGFKRFNFDKFLNAVLIFSEGGQFKTVLNKFLFYADFLHCKKCAVSTTGMRYAHMPHGPALDKNDYFFALLEEQDFITAEEVAFDEYVGKRYYPCTQADRGVFSESELLCLLRVKEEFKGWTAKKLSDYSHEESAYKKTNNGNLISYSLAEDLSLDIK